MNSLNTNLKGKAVVLKEFAVTGTNSVLTSRLFRVESGFGADPHARGTTVQGQFLANRYYGNQRMSIDAEDIERLATPREEALV